MGKNIWYVIFYLNCLACGSPYITSRIQHLDLLCWCQRKIISSVNYLADEWLLHLFNNKAIHPEAFEVHNHSHTIQVWPCRREKKPRLMHEKHTSLMYENKCKIVLLGNTWRFLGLELQTAPWRNKRARGKKWRSSLRKKVSLLWRSWLGWGW